MWFRDIGYILKQAGKQEEHTQMQSISSLSYKLFSDGKTVLQVEIALSLVMNYPHFIQNIVIWADLIVFAQCIEMLKEIFGLLLIYINPKSSGMNESNVIKLLTIGNNDLPAVEDIYESRKRKEGELEGKIRNSTMIFQDLNNQILSMRSMVILFA